MVDGTIECQIHQWALPVERPGVKKGIYGWTLILIEFVEFKENNIKKCSMKRQTLIPCYRRVNFEDRGP
jgi:hypothetical protein